MCVCFFFIFLFLFLVRLQIHFYAVIAHIVLFFASLHGRWFKLRERGHLQTIPRNFVRKNFFCSNSCSENEKFIIIAFASNFWIFSVFLDATIGLFFHFQKFRITLQRKCTNTKTGSQRDAKYSQIRSFVSFSVAENSFPVCRLNGFP